jgi:hypothetical protein
MRHVTNMVGIINATKFYVGRPEGKRPLGKYRHRWKDKNQMDLKEIGCQSVDWIHLAQDAVSWQGLVNKVINLCVP